MVFYICSIFLAVACPYPEDLGEEMKEEGRRRMGESIYDVKKDIKNSYPRYSGFKSLMQGVSWSLFLSTNLYLHRIFLKSSKSRGIYAIVISLIICISAFLYIVLYGDNSTLEALSALLLYMVFPIFLLDLLFVSNSPFDPGSDIVYIPKKIMGVYIWHIPVSRLDGRKMAIPTWLTFSYLICLFLAIMPIIEAALIFFLFRDGILLDYPLYSKLGFLFCILFLLWVIGESFRRVISIIVVFCHVKLNGENYGSYKLFKILIPSLWRMEHEGYDKVILEFELDAREKVGE